MSEIKYSQKLKRKSVIRKIAHVALPRTFVQKPIETVE